MLKRCMFAVSEPYHSLCGDSLIHRNMVLDIGIGRPDRGDHDCDTLCAVCCLDTQPKDSQNTSRNNTEVCEVVSKGGSNGDREGDMEFCADGTVQDHGNCNTAGSNHDDLGGLSVRIPRAVN